MPFLSGVRKRTKEVAERAKTKARTAYEEKKEQVKTGYQKWQQAEPQKARTINTRREYRTKGIITNGLFVGNGAGLTGIMPKKKKKAKKAATVIIRVEGGKATAGARAKRRKPKARTVYDITNIHGSI